MPSPGSRTTTVALLAACLGGCSSSRAPAGDAGATVDAGARDAGDARPDDAGRGTPADAGPPTLVSLALAAADGPDAGAALGLTPAFSPGVHDYYARCGAGPRAVSVTMKASAGAGSLLVQPAASPDLPEQTVSVTVSEGEAIVAVATGGAASTSYWVRCLPVDMTAFSWDPHPGAGTRTPGYYLVGDEFPAPGAGAYAFVLDENGVPVWYARAPAGQGACDVDSIVPGAVSFIPFSETPFLIGSFQIETFSPPSVATLTASGEETDVHELRALPNGDYLVFSWPLVTGVDLTGLTVPLPDGGTEALGSGETMIDCVVLELTPAGEVAWSWTASDHFDPVKDSPSAQLSGDTYDLVDVFHCNSIDVDPATLDLLISARNMDSIFYVDRSTGELRWKMGGAAFNRDSAPYVKVASPFTQQHDARLQPGWSPACGGHGQVSLFDDQSGGASPARAVLYDVVVDADGDGGCDAGAEGARATVAWQYAGSASSAGAGSFRISGDGSRVVGWGLGVTPGLVLTEVDAEGHDLLDVGFGDGTWSYRAIKVPTSAFDLDALRRAAGAP